MNIPAPRYKQLKEDRDVLLVKAIKALPVPHEPIIFTMGGFKRLYDPAYVPGYPQIDPLLEYYFDSRPILCFTQPKNLVADLLYLSEHSVAPFSAIIITGEKKQMNAVVSALREEGAFASPHREPSLLQKRYVLVLPEAREEIVGSSRAVLKQ